MLRLAGALTLLLTLALGTLAEASPAIVIESVTVEKDGAGTTLRFTARSEAGAPMPETGTAVVMQVDGNRSKCLTVSLLRTGTSDGLSTYAGRFNFLYSGASILTGRAEIGGTIVDFSAPLDGKAGKVTRATDQTNINAQAAPVVITPQPVYTPDPATVDPKTAAAPVTTADTSATPAKPTGIAGLATEPAAWLGLIAILSAAATAYLDRKRALARPSAA